MFADSAGAVLVEYAMILSLLAFAFIGGMQVVEQATLSALTYVQAELLNYGSRNGL